jgi:hypothetical protein
MSVTERVSAAAAAGRFHRKTGPTVLPLGNKPFDLKEKLR